MTSKERRYFDYSSEAPASFWRPIASEAEATIPGVYSATFFAKHNISIVDQQVRSFNLSFALGRARMVTAKSRVAVIGAGVSGMTCAVALTMLKGCHCAVFDRDTMLFRQFREASFRFLHPDLNASTDSDAALFDLSRKTNFAFLNWTANFAPMFADELCNKFDHYRRSSPISLHLKHTVRNISASEWGPVVHFSDQSKFTFDIVIIATGFGRERRTSFTNDASYWHSGNPVQYTATALRGRKSRERVLISGNGDSGILELAHFLLRDFRHSHILSLLPSNDLGRAGSVGILFAAGVAEMWFRQIELGNEQYPNADGPLSWYWWFKEHDPGTKHSIGSGVARSYLEQIFNTFESKLASHPIGKKVAPDTLTNLEKAIEPILNELASIEIEMLMNRFQLDMLLPHSIHRQFREDFDVTIVGPSPSIYSRRQAPQNWFLVYILLRYGRFKYLRARFDRAEVRARGIFVHFKDSKRTLTTDRLVFRQGPTYDTLGYKGVHAKLPKSQFRLTHLRNLERESDPETSKIRDAFITAFRTARWKRSIARAFRFEDTPDSAPTWHSLPQMQEQLDTIFLHMRELGFDEEAYRLYRVAKNKSTSRALAGPLSQMMQVVKEAHATEPPAPG